jgi:hypothetical protein
MPTIEDRLAAIEERNRRVEADKAWEISWERRVLIAVVTFFATLVVFRYADTTKPWLAGLLAVIGFIISTLTMPILKSHWVKHILEKRRSKNVTIH